MPKKKTYIPNGNRYSSQICILLHLLTLFTDMNYRAFRSVCTLYLASRLKTTSFCFSSQGTRLGSWATPFVVLIAQDVGKKLQPDETRCDVPHHRNTQFLKVNPKHLLKGRNHELIKFYPHAFPWRPAPMP